MSYPIATVEGIGPNMAAKLKAAGIKNTMALLDAAREPKGRKALAEKTGIEESRILKWANLCDLMRIKGVAEEYSELLEAAGVDTVKELRNRNAGSLTTKMAEVNAAKRLVRVVPSESAVQKWIEQAKTLPPTLTY